MIVDVHSHILPGVDDGASDFEIAKQMIRMSYDEGCRHLFLTPHADERKYKERVELHCHTGFSEMDGTCSVRDILRFANEQGMSSVAFTDHEADLSGE